MGAHASLCSVTIIWACFDNSKFVVLDYFGEVRNSPIELIFYQGYLGILNITISSLSSI